MGSSADPIASGSSRSSIPIPGSRTGRGRGARRPAGRDPHRRDPRRRARARRLAAQVVRDRRRDPRRETDSGDSHPDPGSGRPGTRESSTACTDATSDDAEIAAAARARGVELIDLRKSKPKHELHFWQGDIYRVRAPRLAVLGTDCAIGKRNHRPHSRRRDESGRVANGDDLHRADRLDAGRPLRDRVRLDRQRLRKR